MYEISNIYWNRIFGYLSHLRDMFCLLFVGIIRHSNPNFLLSLNDHNLTNNAMFMTWYQYHINFSSSYWNLRSYFLDVKLEEDIFASSLHKKLFQVDVL